MAFGKAIKICGLWRYNQVGPRGEPKAYWVGSQMAPEFYDKLFSQGNKFKFMITPAPKKIRARNGEHAPDMYLSILPLEPKDPAKVEEINQRAKQYEELNKEQD